MRIDDFGIESIPHGEVLQLLCNAACCDAFTEAVEEQVTGGAVLLCEPFGCFLAQSGRKEQSTHLAAFGVYVKITGVDVFYFDLHQFADTCAGSSKKPHHKIPFHVIVLAQCIFEESVIGVADDIFKIRALLYLD